MMTGFYFYTPDHSKMDYTKVLFNCIETGREELFDSIYNDPTIRVDINKTHIVCDLVANFVEATVLMNLPLKKKLHFISKIVLHPNFSVISSEEQCLDVLGFLMAYCEDLDIIRAVLDVCNVQNKWLFINSPSCIMQPIVSAIKLRMPADIINKMGRLMRQSSNSRILVYMNKISDCIGVDLMDTIYNTCYVDASEGKIQTIIIPEAEPMPVPLVHQIAPDVCMVTIVESMEFKESFKRDMRSCYTPVTTEEPLIDIEMSRLDSFPQPDDKSLYDSQNTFSYSPRTQRTFSFDSHMDVPYERQSNSVSSSQDTLSNDIQDFANTLITMNGSHTPLMDDEESGFLLI
jgi:hypothetical protein